MVTIKEISRNLHPNINKNNNTQKNHIEEIKITNHSDFAYKLTISAHALNTLNTINKEEVLIFNPEVLSYTKDLDLIKKFK